MRLKSGSAYNWFLFILLCLIWGSSFILMKKGLNNLNAFQVASLRIISAGMILLPVGWNKFRTIARKDLFLVFVSGLLGTFIPAYLFCLAETKIDSGLASVLNALTPLFTLIIGAFFFQSKLALHKWIGVLIGMVGLILLLTAGKELRFNHIGFAGLITIATICYGINVNLVSRYLKHISSTLLAAGAFAMLILPAIMILLWTGYTYTPITIGFAYSTGAALVLGIFGTAIASILFYELMKKAGPLFASMVTYGIPFVGIFWGIADGESLGLVQVSCLFLILSGVYLANKK
ncbi:MAG: DMT family transporter [Sphingobacteriales bacterium]